MASGTIKHKFTYQFKPRNWCRQVHEDRLPWFSARSNFATLIVTVPPRAALTLVPAIQTNGPC